MTSLTLRMSTVALVLTALAGAGTAQTPLGTAFTYQGSLEQSGNAATGSYDLRFRLFNASSAGSEVGTAQCADNVGVVDGVFTVQLDFGTTVFTGEARWLEVSVRSDTTPGNCSANTPLYTTLLPRQPLTATPYALFALSGPGQAGYWAGNGNGIYSTNSGNVGIGRSAPTAKLDLFSRFTEPDPALRVQRQVTGSLFNSLTIDGAKIESDGNAVLDNPLELNAASDNSVLIAGGGGRVGIGTNAPRHTLSVGANLDIYSGAASNHTRPAVRGSNLDNLVLSASGTGATYFNFDGGTGGVRFHNGTSAGEVMRIDSDGDVAIGTTTTSGRLTVSSSNSSAALYVTSSDNGGPVASFSSGLNPSFSGSVVSVTTGGSSGRAGSFTNVNAASTGAALYCRTNGSGPALWADGLARVEVLEITGADVAERFPITGAHDRVEPGTVMEIDPDSVGKLRIAHGAYSRRVAGVVSGAGNIPTGTILGNMAGSQGAPPIALSGRVWVLCDAADCAIEAGDLLTTSPVAGHAMKVVDSPRAQGAVLGKAMSSLARGERGLVLVLVTLQ